MPDGFTVATVQLLRSSLFTYPLPHAYARYAPAYMPPHYTPTLLRATFTAAPRFAHYTHHALVRAPRGYTTTHRLDRLGLFGCRTLYPLRLFTGCSSHFVLRYAVCHTCPTQLRHSSIQFRVWVITFGPYGSLITCSHYGFCHVLHTADTHGDVRTPVQHCVATYLRCCPITAPPSTDTRLVRAYTLPPAVHLPAAGSTYPTHSTASTRRLHAHGVTTHGYLFRNTQPSAAVTFAVGWWFLRPAIRFITWLACHFPLRRSVLPALYVLWRCTTFPTYHCLPHYTTLLLDDCHCYCWLQRHFPFVPTVEDAFTTPPTLTVTFITAPMPRLDALYAHLYTHLHTFRFALCSRLPARCLLRLLPHAYPSRACTDSSRRYCPGLFVGLVATFCATTRVTGLFTCYLATGMPTPAFARHLRTLRYTHCRCGLTFPTRHYAHYVTDTGSPPPRYPTYGWFVAAADVHAC